MADIQPGQLLAPVAANELAVVGSGKLFRFYFVLGECVTMHSSKTVFENETRCFKGFR